jgi:hypothetical protein
VCFITAGPITKLFAWGEEESGGVSWVCVCVCSLLQDLVQSCLHGGGIWEDMSGLLDSFFSQPATDPRTIIIICIGIGCWLTENVWDLGIRNAIWKILKVFTKRGIKNNSKKSPLSFLIRSVFSLKRFKKSRTGKQKRFKKSCTIWYNFESPEFLCDCKFTGTNCLWVVIY